MVLLLGVVVWAYQGYQVYRSVKVVDCRISNVVFDEWETIPVPGVPVPIPFPKKVTVDFEVVLENPSGASVEVSLVTYDVYIEETYLGTGGKRGVVVVPGANRLTFSLGTGTERLLTVLGRLIYEAISRGLRYIDADVEVRGVVRLPVKLFGVIEVGSLAVTIPYSIRETYRVWIRRPGQPSPNPPVPPGTSRGVIVYVHGRSWVGVHSSRNWHQVTSFNFQA